MVGIHEWVPVDVPNKPGPMRAPAGVGPEDANRLVADACHRMGIAKEPRFFTDEDTRRMTADTFLEPRIDILSYARNNEKETLIAEVISISSPESRRVYAVDRSKRFPMLDGLQHWEERRETEVIAFLNALRIERVSIHVSKLCEFLRLAPNAQWFAAKL